MNLSKSFEFKGYWWLPSTPDNKVAGVLTYKPGESIVLELIGSFGDDSDAVVAFMNKSEEAVIHGKLENAKDVALLRCYPSGSINFSNFFPIIRYSCIYCFIGRHYKNIDDEGDFKVSAHFPEMSYWCHPGILREYFLEDEGKNGQIISLSFKVEESGKVIDEVELDGGIKLQLKACASFNGVPALLENRIGQSSWVEFSSKEKVSFQKLMSCVYRFEEFLSLATLRVAEMSEITFYDKDYYQELGEGKRHYHPVYFLSSHWRGTDTDKVDSIRFLFGYDAIKDSFSDIISAWYC